MLLSSMLADPFIQDVINRKPQAPMPPGSAAGSGALLPGATQGGDEAGGAATPRGSAAGAGDALTSPVAAGPTGASSFSPVAAGPTGASTVSTSTMGGGAGGNAAAMMGVGDARVSESGAPTSEHE